jgi:hypothetical protein
MLGSLPLETNPTLVWHLPVDQDAEIESLAIALGMDAMTIPPYQTQCLKGNTANATIQNKGMAAAAAADPSPTGAPVGANVPPAKGGV